MIIILILPASTALREHRVLSSTSLIYHLDDVHCNGYESLLSECKHAGIGVNNCLTKKEEAGVMCSGKPFLSHNIHYVWTTRVQ